MKKALIATITGIAMLGLVAVVAPAMAASNGGGFDQYGYNNSARIFNGTYSSWCQAKIGFDKATCDSYLAPYGNDQLVMKWNVQWDACNAAGNDSVSACLGAWTDNEFNGKIPGGSGQVWHLKIIWVGSAEANSPYWAPGGEPIWGAYEVIMDQGVDPNVGPGHIWFAHAVSNGYGN